MLITGGSAGIVKALAAELLARGARVSLLARTESRLEATCNELRESAAAKSAAAKSATVKSAAAKSAAASAPPSSAVQLQYVCAAISDEAAMSVAVESASTRFGPVEVLVCNASSAAPGLFAQMPVETFARQMDVNYIGTVSFFSLHIHLFLPQKVTLSPISPTCHAPHRFSLQFVTLFSFSPTYHAHTFFILGSHHQEHASWYDGSP